MFTAENFCQIQPGKLSRQIQKHIQHEYPHQISISKLLVVNSVKFQNKQNKFQCLASNVCHPEPRKLCCVFHLMIRFSQSQFRNLFQLYAYAILIQQKTSNSMDQRVPRVGQETDIHAYQDTEEKLRKEFARAEQSLVQFQKMMASNYLDEDDRSKLFKSMQPFKNFVENKTKATILCSGSISSGKSSLLNALLGNCILPSGQLETTETITKLVPTQELNSNTFILTTGKGQKQFVKELDLYRFHQELNIQKKQKTENPLLLEIETNFLVLNYYKKNPLLQRHQLEFVDLPGCDSEQEGKDQRILDFSSKLGDFPKLILFIISPENISKKSTSEFFLDARKVYIDEINHHKRVQNEFYTILQGIKGKEIIKDRQNENTEKLVQQRLCIVISKFDSVGEGEAKKIEEQFLTKYKIQPNFVSSKKQIEYNTLKHWSTPLNISILLNDKEMKKQALKFLPKNQQSNLSQLEPSSWTESDIQNVLDNVAKLLQRSFDDEDDETVEDSTRIQQLVFELMIKITNECTQYLKNNSRRIEYLQEIFSIGLSETMIDKYIIPKDFKLFQSARAQCSADLERMKITFQEEYKKALNYSIKKVENTFKKVETFVSSIWQNLKSFNKEIFEQKLEDIFQTPLEDTMNEFQENMENLTEYTIESTVNSMRSRMPFLNGEIHTKIRLIFKGQMLARQQIGKINFFADDIQQIRQQIRSLTWMLVLSVSSIGGIILVETIGAATAWTGFGLFFLIAGIAMSAGIRKKTIKTKQEISYTLAQEQNKLIQSLSKKKEDNYKSNIQDLTKSLEKVLYALDNAYAYKNTLET